MIEAGGLIPSQNGWMRNNRVYLFLNVLQFRVRAVSAFWTSTVKFTSYASAYRLHAFTGGITHRLATLKTSSSPFGYMDMMLLKPLQYQDFFLFCVLLVKSWNRWIWCKEILLVKRLIFQVRWQIVLNSSDKVLHTVYKISPSTDAFDFCAIICHMIDEPVHPLTLNISKCPKIKRSGQAFF